MSAPLRSFVVYYSRTGTTAALGQKIARALAAFGPVDSERLTDTVDRGGARGFFRSLVDTVARRRTTLGPLGRDPSEYDLVVVGTPVWGSTVSVPIRTLLHAHGGRLPAVAFFLTDGASSHDLVFRDMAKLARAEPIACLGLAHDEVEHGGDEAAVARFVAALVERCKVAPAPSPTSSDASASNEPARTRAA